MKLIYLRIVENQITIFVPAAYSSQKCGCCGFTHKDNRVSQSRFICQDCGFECNADLNAAINIKTRGVQAVLNNEVDIKVPKKIAFRRAGTAQTDAKASTPVERVSAVPAYKPLRSSRLKQETPTRTAVSFGGG